MNVIRLDELFRSILTRSHKKYILRPFKYNKTVFVNAKIELIHSTLMIMIKLRKNLNIEAVPCSTLCYSYTC